MKEKNRMTKCGRCILVLLLFVLLGAVAKPDYTRAANYIVMNGTYKINTKVKGNMLLDVAGGSSKNGANIQIYQDNGTTAQHFNVTYLGSGWHKIINVASGKSLDVTGAVRKSGANVQLYQYNGTDAQKWRFVSAGSGYYYIQNKLGFYLDVAGGSSKNGTNVCVYSQNNTAAQKWKMINIIYPKSVKLNTSSVTLTSIGATKKLTASISPSNATQKNITWSSSDACVATVSNGTVQAVGRGKAVIKATTVNGKAAATTVTVNDGCVDFQEGLYCFNSKVGSNMMLDVDANSTVNGSNIQIYKNNNSKAQKFYVKKAGYGWYVIYNAYPAQCLDVKDGSKANGANVQLYKFNKSDAQKWRFYSAGNGYYYVMNKLGRYLDVAGAGTKNNTNVLVYTKNNTDAQKWKLVGTKADYVNVANGVYYINSRLGSNMMLDVAGNGTDNRTNIDIYKKNNSMGQIFKIEGTSDGWYKIIHLFSNKCLDVSGASSRNGTNVHLYESNNTEAQKWNFILSGDGQYFTIKSKLGKKSCLDVKDGSAINGANVQIYDANNSSAQKWGLTEANIIDLTGIGLDTGSFSLSVGQTRKIGVKYYPSNATGANTWVNWKSSNAGVATVEKDGTVRAVAAGSATITAKSYNEKTASVTVTVNGQSGQTEYDKKVNSFQNNASWRNGASWPAAKKPILTPGYQAYGCCAYAADFIKYVFGYNVGAYGFGNRTFFSPSQIQAGDVIKVVNNQHWFVVLYRNGSRLTTAEGNWEGKVVISSSLYTVNGNTLYRNGRKFRTFSCGYHFR